MAHSLRDIWPLIRAATLRLDTAVHARRPTFSDAQIILLVLWGRAHHQSVKWACDAHNWPLHERRNALPDASTVSRRMRTRSVLALLDALSDDPLARQAMVQVADGKPLVVSRHTRDRDARHGWGAGGMDTGYKLHLIGNLLGNVSFWRVTPMHSPEQEITRRCVNAAHLAGGYLLGDCAYDADALHRTCANRNLRLLVYRYPSRRGKGVGSRNVSSHRRSCIASTETPNATFAPAMLALRISIERIFARLETRWRIGRPPAHVRGLARVRLWVQTALALDKFTQLALHAKTA
jgi:hypothetical protein